MAAGALGRHFALGSAARARWRWRQRRWRQWGHRRDPRRHGLSRSI